jgi:hypothetical protein
VVEGHERIKKLYNEQKSNLGFQVLGVDNLNIDDLFLRHAFVVKHEMTEYLYSGIDSSFNTLSNCFNAENLDVYQSNLYYFFFTHDCEEEYKRWLKVTMRIKKIKNFLSDK